MVVMTAAGGTQSAVRKRGMRCAVWAQTFGVMGMSTFQNGLLLLYMTVLGLRPSLILTFLALSDALSVVARVPLAHVADRVGKKRLGAVGLIMVTVGYALLPLAGFTSRPNVERIMLSGIAILAAGRSLFMCSWMALLNDLIPVARRGRFFARMRGAFQVSSLLFGLVCACLLGRNSPLWLFQVLLAFAAVAFFMRYIMYRGVPDLGVAPVERSANCTFRTACMTALRAPGYASFCAYAFLLTLFTAGAGNLFALIEKNVLQLSGG
jgi:MFS family permease